MTVGRAFIIKQTIVKMTTKRSISDFSDRELLEIILFNQVQSERRLDRIEDYLRKQSSLYYSENGTHSSFSGNFETLIQRVKEVREQANDYLKQYNEFGY